MQLSLSHLAQTRRQLLPPLTSPIPLLLTPLRLLLTLLLLILLLLSKPKARTKKRENYRQVTDLAVFCFYIRSPFQPTLSHFLPTLSYFHPTSPHFLPTLSHFLPTLPRFLPTLSHFLSVLSPTLLFYLTDIQQFCRTADEGCGTMGQEKIAVAEPPQHADARQRAVASRL